MVAAGAASPSSAIHIPRHQLVTLLPPLSHPPVVTRQLIATAQVTRLKL